MSRGIKLTGLLMAGVLCLPGVTLADTQSTRHAHSKKKAPPLPPPLPSGTRGPVPQIPLDSITPVAPQVTYEGGLLTIVAPNSTLGDILRGVRKNTAADIDIPATANERVVTRLGPAPPSEVMAELLNGSRFNYILLGSPTDANALVKVVLVAKTSDTPAPNTTAAANGALPVPTPNGADAAAAEAETEDTADEGAEAAAEAEPAPTPNPEQPGAKTPQQMLQEMQQRQLQLQQQQAIQPGTAPLPPGLPAPRQPGTPQPQDQ